jgi:hypothetical protein
VAADRFGFCNLRGGWGLAAGFYTCDSGARILSACDSSFGRSCRVVAGFRGATTAHKLGAGVHERASCAD